MAAFEICRHDPQCEEPVEVAEIQANTMAVLHTEVGCWFHIELTEVSSGEEQPVLNQGRCKLGYWEAFGLMI